MDAPGATVLVTRRCIRAMYVSLRRKCRGNGLTIVTNRKINLKKQVGHIDDLVLLVSSRFMTYVDF